MEKAKMYIVTLGSGETIEIKAYSEDGAINGLIHEGRIMFLEEVKSVTLK